MMGASDRSRRRRLAAGLALAASAFLSVACTRPPALLSRYASFEGINGIVRPRAHTGLDLASPLGGPVLAPTDGRVDSIERDPKGCGLSLLLAHAAFGRFSLLCHLGSTSVRVGDVVARGALVGTAGDSGLTSSVPHVHWQLCRARCPVGTPDGVLQGTEDPLPLVEGCFSPGRAYAKDRLVFTWPIACR